jgi:curved DNA-binding protein CbpA
VPSNESHYEILGVERTASPDQVRSAYLKLVHEYHPDRHQDNPLKDLAAQKLARVNEAYQTLSNARRRAAYDAELGGPISGQRSRRAPQSALSTNAQRLLMMALLVLAIPLLLRFGLPLLRLLLRMIRLVFSIL